MSKKSAPMMQTRIVTITSKDVNALLGGPFFFLSSNSFVMDWTNLNKPSKVFVSTLEGLYA